MLKKEIFESLRLPLASVLIEFQKIILTIYCVFRMVSLMGPHGSHGSHRSIFSLQATGILIWSQWKNSEGVGKSVRSVRSVWENKKLRKESKIRKIREIRVQKSTSIIIFQSHPGPSSRRGFLTPSLLASSPPSLSRPQ